MTVDESGMKLKWHKDFEGQVRYHTPENGGRSFFDLFLDTL